MSTQQNPTVTSWWCHQEVQVCTYYTWEHVYPGHPEKMAQQHFLMSPRSVRVNRTPEGLQHSNSASTVQHNMGHECKGWLTTQLTRHQLQWAQYSVNTPINTLYGILEWALIGLWTNMYHTMSCAKINTSLLDTTSIIQHVLYYYFCLKVFAQPLITRRNGMLLITKRSGIINN